MPKWFFLIFNAGKAISKKSYHPKKLAHHSNSLKNDGSFHVKSNHAVVNCAVLNFLSIKLTFAVEWRERDSTVLHQHYATHKAYFCVAFSACHAISQKNLVIIICVKKIGSTPFYTGLFTSQCVLYNRPVLCVAGLSPYT